ncbi:ROK family protein [Schumannella soli]|uniref:ROK family protein n=1 Tax=Schumannella soli TaxID=2590779 RepID=UPI0015E85CFA|nr:ROK family protein [Schumannella soli]
MTARLGVDIGGTSTRAVVVDESGVIGEAEATSGRGVVAALDVVLATAQAALESAGRPTTSSIGAGVPGVVDARAGIVRHAVNLEIDEWHLREQLEDRLGLPAAVDNDVNAAALGARRALQIEESLAYLNLGTGVAAGIVGVSGVLRGARGGAGEVGHLSVDPRGPRCGCGRRGCIEAYAGGRFVDGRALFRMPAASPERQRFGWAVASAVISLLLMVDVEHVVVGGGMARSRAALLETISNGVVALEADSTFIAGLDAHRRLQVIDPGIDVAAIGAALLSRESAR